MASDDDRERELFGHLAEEFGDRGMRAVEFLRTAAGLLRNGDTGMRIAESACYCLREALKGIPQAAEAPQRQPWRDASRRVIDARKQYDIAASLPGGERESALADLLRAIDDLGLVHSQERIHQQRLLAVMVARTGTTPIPMAPIEAYQRLVDRLDDLLHSSTTLSEAKSLYDEATGLLRQLFLPPDVRLPELAELAQAASPSAEDADRLTPLIASPRHLEYFFERVRSADWLWLLDGSDLLAPPDGQGSWPVFRLVDHLKGTDAKTIGDWLAHAYEQWGSSRMRAWFIARAALDIGGEGHTVVLAALRAHLADSAIAHLGLFLVEAVPPEDDVVVDVGDLLLNPASGLQRRHGLEELAEAFSAGATLANWRRRAEVLLYKLKAVGEDDHYLSMLRYDRSGSIADIPSAYDDERAAILVAALTGVLSAAQAAGATGTDLLDAVDPAEEALRARLRAWLLGRLEDVSLEVAAQEVTAAISTRPPCGDDLALVDRVLGGGADALIPRWHDALGAPPTVEEVGAALADGPINESWMRARQWSALLPSEASTAWSKVNAVLATVFGAATREALTARKHVEAGWGTSPLSEAELRDMPVNDAADWVAKWRPDPNAWLVGSRELARTLQAVVKESPELWSASPLEVVTRLRETIYVSHYFRGLSEAEALDPRQAADIVEAVAFARTHPWAPTPMGRDDWDWEPNWDSADDDGVTLLRRLAEKDVGFGDRAEQAWALVLEAATRHDGPGGYDDTLTSAINRHQTRAVEAVFAFMGWQYRRSETVQEDALRLLDHALRIDGRDGEEHRAVIVPRLPFLLYVAPEWVEARSIVMFGDQAPEGLAQAAADLYVRWGRPHRWVFERARGHLLDAVRRNVDNALTFWLIGVVWQVDTYSVPETVRLLAGMGEDRLSQAGEAMARLLRYENVDPEHLRIGVEFFEAVLALEQPSALPGFGWYAELDSLDDEVWLTLTARAAALAGGRLDWAHKVADRAAASASERGLQILNALVRGLVDEWDRGRVMEQALGLLRATAATLRETEAFRRLRTSLLERGMFAAEDV
jgi:hypothetical protein